MIIHKTSQAYANKIINSQELRYLKEEEECEETYSADADSQILEDEEQAIEKLNDASFIECGFLSNQKSDDNIKQSSILKYQPKSS